MRMLNKALALLMTAVMLMAVPGPYAFAEEGLDLSQGIDVQADRLEYQSDATMLIGEGNVVITVGTDVLRADYVDVNTETQEAHAKGNVQLERDGQVWEGDELSYNFETQEGDFGTFTAFISPFFITANDSERLEDGTFELENARITTCKGKNPEFYITGKETSVDTEEEYVKAKHVTFRLWDVPFFYVPYWKKYYGDDRPDIDFVPGYGSRLGAYLLTAYNYHIDEYTRSTTHLDLRSKRGVAVGQDLYWKGPDNVRKGSIQTYLLHDANPEEGDEDNTERKELIDNPRYRIRLSDARSLTDRDSLITEINYLSDPFVVEDFFDDEYRRNVQPENRVNLNHRSDNYSAGVLLNKRLNDFYDSIERVPEGYLDINQQPLLESGIYYRSQNSASGLKKVYKESANTNDYDSVRINSFHMFSYPGKYLGWLNIIPRAGYQGTYYSKSPGAPVTNISINTAADGTVTTNTTTTIGDDGGSQFRNLVELGFETSFKAFGVWTEDAINVQRGDKGLRHIFEPYANYTFVPEPNVRPYELYQFDEIDALDKKNEVMFGMRNKLQTKRRGMIHNLLDLDIYTTYHLDPEPTEDDFSNIYFDAKIRAYDWLPVDFDGSVDTEGDGLETFNIRFHYLTIEDTRLSVEHRYRKDAQNLLAGELMLFPNRKWSFKAYGRYEFENDDLQEHSYFVQRRFECVGLGVGFKQIENDSQVWFKFWLLALPDSIIELGK